jgi:mono/diheme cytochrome c family protein
MKRRTTILAVAALWLGAAVLASVTNGCGPERRSTPYTRELDTTSTTSDRAVAEGERVFAANCHQCHPGGAGGLGPAINDKPLPVTLIKTQVRQGLGAMPAFSRDEVSDAQLDDIARYLKALRSLH